MNARARELMLVGALACFIASTESWAGAELRLYRGRFEFDLKQTVSIALESGEVTVQNYRKACSAFAGCKAVPTDQLVGVEGVSSKDLEDLKAAVARLDPSGSRTDTAPSKSSICAFGARFAYVVPGASGAAVQVAEYQGCAGKRLQGADAEAIERIVNIAASNAGL